MDGWIFHLSSHLLDELTDETFCLSERHQCAKREDANHDFFRLSKGVPQGSVLGRTSKRESRICFKCSAGCSC